MDERIQRALREIRGAGLLEELLDELLAVADIEVIKSLETKIQQSKKLYRARRLQEAFDRPDATGFLAQVDYRIGGYRHGTGAFRIIGKWGSVFRIDTSDLSAETLRHSVVLFDETRYCLGRANVTNSQEYESILEVDFQRLLDRIRKRINV